MKNHAENLGWEVGVDFPVWANTEIYVKTISNGLCVFYFWFRVFFYFFVFNHSALYSF